MRVMARASAQLDLRLDGESRIDPSAAARSARIAPPAMREGDRPGRDAGATRSNQPTAMRAPSPGRTSARDAAPASDHRRVVAIDGPAAAGKSTVAQALAKRLGAMLFDTGTLYRAVTLAALRAAVPFDDAAALAELAEERHIDVLPPSAPDGRLYDVRLDGEDVTWPIRDPAVEARVSEVSAHPEVRAALLPAQRRIAAAGPVVMVGRDIGTVVVPDAGVKIFLEASLPERARRRHDELLDRGEDIGIADVLADLERRDAIDRGRRASPLRSAEDAAVIATDGIPAAEVVEHIRNLVLDAWRAQDKYDQPVVPARDRR